MRRNLTHCGKKIPTLAVYSVRDFEPFSQLFLFAGGPCPQCGKIPIGHAGYDLWGHPMAFLANGAPIPSEEKSSSPPIAMARKKASQRYLRLIENGTAQKLDSLPTTARPQRGGPAGVSEFSLRAAKAHQRTYVLKLTRNQS
jgi:hypothetical protein